MSIQLQNIIDREELTIQSKKLAEYNQTLLKINLHNNIDDLVEGFISNNVSADDYETITLVYKLAKEIKDII